MSTPKPKTRILQGHTKSAVPKHIEVINFLLKNHRRDLSWVSDVEIPPKPTRSS